MASQSREAARGDEHDDELGHDSRGQGRQTARTMDKSGRVSIYVSSSVLAAIAGLGGSIGAEAWRNDSAKLDNALARVKAESLEEARRQFVSKDVSETRWGLFGINVEEQLRAIRTELSLMRQQTSELPKLAAKLESLERERQR